MLFKYKRYKTKEELASAMSTCKLKSVVALLDYSNGQIEITYSFLLVTIKPKKTERERSRKHFLIEKFFFHFLGESAINRVNRINII